MKLTTDVAAAHLGAFPHCIRSQQANSTILWRAVQKGCGGGGRELDAKHGFAFTPRQGTGWSLRMGSVAAFSTLRLH
eukprot:6425192-Amphidinium_carterae.1